jgi:predicted nucleic acid-binding Zn ribbon protein
MPEGRAGLSLAMLKLKFLPDGLKRLRAKEPRVEQARSGLEKIVAQSLRLAPRAEAPLMAWPVVCGSAVAERTRALGFSDGVLIVEVNGQRWKSELQALAPRYLAMINRYTTEPVLRIEFVVARTESADKKSF